MNAFGEGCPNVTTFEYCQPVSGTESTPDKISNLICQWSKLRSVHCKDVMLNAAAVTHLSHMPNLDYLWFEQSNTAVDRIQSSSSPLTFQARVHYDLFSRHPATVCRFFDHLRLLCIERLQVAVEDRPTEPELESLLASLPNVCNHQSLLDIFLNRTGDFDLDSPYHIDFHHLSPLTVFANIQRIRIRIPYGVDLSERELLRLASSWPCLQYFIVGQNEGYTASSAITPGGFVQLLERWRSLIYFSFPFDTRGYTEIPQGYPWQGLEMQQHSAVDAPNSVIEEESIEALSVFFHIAPFPEFFLWSFFGESGFVDPGLLPEPLRVYYDRWERVRKLAQKLWKEKQNL